jgi:hypothetical protein
MIIPLICDQGEREALMKELGVEQAKQEELSTELQKYAACDPDVIRAKRMKPLSIYLAHTQTLAGAQAIALRDAANRWTGSVAVISRFLRHVGRQHRLHQIVVPTKAQSGWVHARQAVWDTRRAGLS